MGRRTLLLLASILMAATGTAIIWVYVQNADARAQQAEQPRYVLRAIGTIPIGTDTGTVASLVQPVAVPARLVPDDAVSTVGQLGGRSASVMIVKGELLTTDQFGAPASDPGVSPGMEAVTVSLPDPNRVAGLLHPDMDVAVYYVDQAGGEGSTAVLLPDVRVTAVGNTTVVHTAQGLPAQIGTQSGVAAANVTLEVPPRDAIRLIMAANRGTLWFAALGAGARPALSDVVTGGQLPAGNG